MRRPQEFMVGDRIAYSAAFLRSTGQTRGLPPEMRAIVISVSNYAPSSTSGKLIEFRRDDGTIDGGLSCNFTLVSRIGIDSALNT